MMGSYVPIGEPTPVVLCTIPLVPVPAPPDPLVVPPAPAPFEAVAMDPVPPPPGVFCTTPALTPRVAEPAFESRTSVSAIGRL